MTSSNKKSCRRKYTQSLLGEKSTVSFSVYNEEKVLLKKYFQELKAKRKEWVVRTDAPDEQMTDTQMEKESDGN